MTKENLRLLRAVRLLGFVEAGSFIALLFVAMPLKYLAGMPMAVKITGSLHGGLFVLYVMGALWVADRLDWSRDRTGLACAAAIIPFGPFLLDGKLFPPENRS